MLLKWNRNLSKIPQTCAFRGPGSSAAVSAEGDAPAATHKGHLHTRSKAKSKCTVVEAEIVHII